MDNGSFIVVCREDVKPDGSKGDYTLATRTVFTERGDADHYASTCSPSREPLVIEGRFKELRFSAE